MVQSLEQYVAQATQAYQPASNAIQAQLNSLPGQLETTNQEINKNYAQQQASLNRARNAAAESASLQAAGSGGSFGGAANLANRRYYDQSFVPAVTQLQTNQANDLANAKQTNENQRTSLNSQLANLQAQYNQQALAQYYADLEAEKNRALQQQQLSAQNAYNQYLIDAMKQSTPAYSLSSTQNMYGGYDWTDAQGNKHRAATVAAAAGGDFNDALWNVLSTAANQGDYYSAQVLNEIRNGSRFAKNTTGSSTGNAMYDTLGIYKVSNGNTSSGANSGFSGR